MKVNSSSALRSRMMAAIRGKNTRPEIAVRRLLHASGFRFRLHRRDLPGRPDIVLPKYKLAILVHGCFWHRHPGCRYATIPKANAEFWQQKFATNVDRDSIALGKLHLAGWRTLVIWECELKQQARRRHLRSRIASAVRSTTRHVELPRARPKTRTRSVP